MKNILSKVMQFISGGDHAFSGNNNSRPMEKMDYDTHRAPGDEPGESEMTTRGSSNRAMPSVSPDKLPSIEYC